MGDQFASVDEYIASFPAEAQAVLEDIRQTVRRAAPDADEKISYEMPTVMLAGKYLFYFSAWKHHVALYAVPELDGELEQRLNAYRGAKGALKFPLAKPFPHELLERIVAVMVEQRLGTDEVTRPGQKR